MKTRIRGGRELNSFVVPRITETRRKLQCNVMCMSAAPRDKDCRFRGTDGVLQRRLYSNCRDARDGRMNEGSPGASLGGRLVSRSSRVDHAEPGPTSLESARG